MSDDSGTDTTANEAETVVVGGEGVAEGAGTAGGTPVALSRCNVKNFNPYMLQKDYNTKLTDEEFLDLCVNYLEDKAPANLNDRPPMLAI